MRFCDERVCRFGMRSSYSPAALSRRSISAISLWTGRSRRQVRKSSRSMPGRDWRYKMSPECRCENESQRSKTCVSQILKNDTKSRKPFSRETSLISPRRKCSRSPSRERSGRHRERREANLSSSKSVWRTRTIASLRHSKRLSSRFQKT